jgi:hypothetical protein
MRSIVLVLAVAMFGCGGSSDTCSQDPARCVDAGQGTCTGQCAQAAPVYKVMLWTGPEGTTPPQCPAVVLPGEATLGYLDAPPSTVTCSPACSCSSSSNACSPPSTMTAGTVTCSGGGGVPFDAPTVWDGTCSAMDPISSARSLTVDPPTLPQGTCVQSLSSVTQFTGGKTVALTCFGLTMMNAEPGVCPNADDECTYPDVPGFTLCLLDDDVTCPPGWPAQHTFYQPACTCACGPATGDVCSTTVTAYEDGACMDAVGSVTLTSNEGPTCTNISPSPAPLGSKKASVNYIPGTCAATLTPIASETLCCLK